MKIKKNFMFKKELYSHLLVTFVYLFLLSVFRLYLGWGLIFLWLGGLVGTFLLDVDHLLLALDKDNQTWWAKRFRFLWENKDYQKALLLLAESHLQHRNLVFHSALFQPLLLILAFFILTSTGSLTGVGLVMSINLHLLKDEWQSFWEEGEIGWLFWQIKRKIDKNIQRAYLLAVTFLFGLLTLFF